jgi:two-component system, OmpR family, phosphate regulon sensor histidine kinase PhoR
MQKNYSPRLTAVITATFTFIVVFLATFIIFNKLLNCLLVATIVFVVVYGTVLYYIQEVLDKKIKTIYKLINQTKAGKRESFYNENLLPRPSLETVTVDVEKWSIDNKEAFELLEKNEQYRREFLQNLSHELKTPITSMKGYVESLLNGALYDDKVNEKFLQNTSNNIQRLMDLVNDLDEITKLENEQTVLEKTVFNSSDIIEEVFNLFTIKAKEKNITLSFKNSSFQNKKVIGDKPKIAQVLTNLIENAIKYGKVNGNVIANIDKINNDIILIEIADDGFGIAQEHLDRIFERFYRTDFARERKVGGSGLGLAICKHIIEAHGHTIYVRSKINVGTTFRFTLNKA